MPASESPPTLSINSLTLQLGGPHGWIDITDPECSLLRAFATSAGQRLDTACILERVGKPGDEFGKRALEVQIVRLRKKLLAAGAPEPTIKSIRGVGYQLCVPLALHPSMVRNP